MNPKMSQQHPDLVGGACAAAHQHQRLPRRLPDAAAPLAGWHLDERGKGHRQAYGSVRKLMLGQKYAPA